VDPYFSATKVAWLLDNVRGLRKRAEAGRIAMGTIDSWLIWNLTGGRVHATDYTNASRTLLYNIHELCWDREILEFFGIPASILPEVRSSSGVFGEATGLGGVGAPIAGVAGDQQAALFGQVCFKEGAAKNTYGTGSFVLLNTGTRPVASEDLLTTIAWRIGDEPVRYALEGSIFVTGAAVQWLRDGLKIIKSAGETGKMAAALGSNDGVYFVPALAGLGAPHWDPFARGAIFGLTRGTTRAHIVRAALESTAYQTRDVIEAMRRESGVALATLRADGGAAANPFLMQFQADMLGVPVEVPVIRETTALGAAYLAGLATGIWTLGGLAKLWRVERRYEPRMKAAERGRLYARWLRAVDRSRAWEDPA
jgi:glycerol kinase